MQAPGLPPLHIVTDDAVLAGEDFLVRAAQVLEAGGAEVALHLRGPTTGGRRLYELAAELVPRARSVGALLLINDRLDVALASGAHGAQLGARGIPPLDARRLLGPDRLLGISVHSAAEAEAAVSAAADFLLVGTLCETASHPGRSGAGTGILRELARFGVPLVGIGGITPARAPGVRRAGAAGVAVLRGVWEANEPGGAVRGYLQAWRDDR